MVMGVAAAHPAVRIVVLVSVWVAATIRGASYLVVPPRAELTFLMTGLIPVKVWGFVWIGSGLLALGGIVSRSLSRYALAFAAVLWAAWGVSYLFGAAVVDGSRGLAVGAGMLCHGVALGALGFLVARPARTG